MFVKSCKLAHTSRLVLVWFLLKYGIYTRITQTMQSNLESPISTRCRLIDSSTFKPAFPPPPPFFLHSFLHILRSPRPPHSHHAHLSSTCLKWRFLFNRARSENRWLVPACSWWEPVELDVSLSRTSFLQDSKNLVIVSIPECRSVYEVYLSAPSALGRLGYY